MKDAINVKMNALPITRYSPPTNPAPSTMARAAPKPAAEDTPRVNSLASGFFKMPCMAAPASANPMPDSMPMRIRSRRRPQTMVFAYDVDSK